MEEEGSITLKSAISATTKYNIHSLFTFMLFIKKKTTYYIITIVVCGYYFIIFFIIIIKYDVMMMIVDRYFPQHVSLVISDADTISTYSGKVE